MENTLFDYSYDTAPPAHNWQRALARAMDEQLAIDIATLRKRGHWPPPWMERDFTLQQDEARLLAAIADNCGLEWADANTAICIATTNQIGMTAIGNAKAVVMRCVQLGYIVAHYDEGRTCQRLDLTEYGRELLDDWEDEQSREQDYG